MCAHANNTNETIELLVQKLYPAIQHQFILISSNTAVDSTKLDHSNVDCFSVLNELKNEFQSLVNYENRLVFPSVIKVFDKKRTVNNIPTPSIADLLQLTKSKEHKILELVTTLENEMSTIPLADKDAAINKLIYLFKNDFETERSKWNNMIQDRLNSCGCFIKHYESKK